MTTRYDDYIWDGGPEKFGSVKNWEEWKRAGGWDPAVPYYPYEKKDDKNADDLFPTKTKDQKKIEELEKHLKKCIQDAKREFEEQQKKLANKIAMLEGIVTSMQDKIEILEQENEKLKKIVNEYNRFDIMDI